jgi:hypothetical protein
LREKVWKTRPYLRGFINFPYNINVGIQKTAGIDLRCPARAELAESFKRGNAAHKSGLRKN